jgi:UDP-glucuronate 4-epimerase
VNKFIFASSSSVYGGNKKTPFSENDRVDRPISPYAMTKKSGELICYTYHHLYNIQIFAFRFFTVYGPRQRPEMAIHKFVREMMNGRDINVFGNGKSSRDYTYIDDIIDGITNSLDVISGYEIFNLGNSKPINIIELIKIIENQAGLSANIVYAENQPGDVFCTYSDISKAKRMINYNPEVPIEVGVKRFIEWYKSKNYKEIT